MAARMGGGGQLDELEGWKEIAGALGVSVATAKRFGRGHLGRRPIPTFMNLRSQRAILRGNLATWFAEGPVDQVDVAPASRVVLVCGDRERCAA